MGRSRHFLFARSIILLAIPTHIQNPSLPGDGSSNDAVASTTQGGCRAGDPVRSRSIKVGNRNRYDDEQDARPDADADTHIPRG